MSRKNHVLYSSLIIAVFITLGFGFVLYSDASYYMQLARKQTERTVALAASDVTKDIKNFASTQIVTAQTMANDAFLRQWLMNEPESLDGPGSLMLREYLKAYKEKYGYDVVFLVSTKTNRYYYEDGLNKIVSPSDTFDSWYYNFLALGNEYDVQVDRSETNDYAVELFINCRILDENGNVLGVVGSGKKIDNIEQRITQCESRLNLKIYIANIGNAENTFTWDTESFKLPSDISEITGLPAEEIARRQETGIIRWIDSRCLRIQPDPELHWNFIIEKDTTPAMEQLWDHTKSDIICMIIIILGCIAVSSAVIRRLELHIREQENMDKLTGLPNAQLFREKLASEQINRVESVRSLILFNMDDFRRINENSGHIYGNTVLKLVAAYISTHLQEGGIFGRNNGDEFIGVVPLSPEKAKKWIDDINERLARRPDIQPPVTFSAGITEIHEGEAVKDILMRVHDALKEAKRSGKNKSIIFEKDL